MRYQIKFLIIIFFSLSISTFASSPADKQGEISTQTAKKSAGISEKDVIIYPIPAPDSKLGVFPCQDCHRKNIRGVSSQAEKGNLFSNNEKGDLLLGTYVRLPDPEPRILVRMHKKKRIKHAEWHWCLNCHSTDERNNLKLITGENVPFEQSHKLCGQCHGSIFRDWKLGIHGRRVGQWNGERIYLLCAHCHDPHMPKFKQLAGENIPKRPDYGRWDSAGHDQDHIIEEKNDHGGSGEEHFQYEEDEIEQEHKDK